MADVVICGAGFAGVSAAYHLAVRHGLRHVVLVDERDPLSLTSARGTECYRNWWPGPGDTMVRFMNRSIDLLEEMARQTDNLIELDRRGYAFFTADPARAAAWRETAGAISAAGAGPLRIHEDGQSGYCPAAADGFDRQPVGADLVLDPAVIRRRYPFVSDRAVALLHTRRCGWFSSRKYGRYQLEQAIAHGARVVRGRVEKVTARAGRVATVHLSPGSEPDAFHTGHFVVAAGPLLRQVAGLLGLELPVFNELHGKLTFEDSLGLIPRDAPLTIWDDPVSLPWDEAESRRLEQEPARRWLLGEMPAGVHFRPVGGPGSRLLWILWTYETQSQEPAWPPRFDPDYAGVVLRGMASLVPAFSAYFGQGGRVTVDGGYYCKTRENRPLIGPLPVAGAYVIGALSGFGLMASQAAADLLAAHLTGSDLPAYAAEFLLERYDDPGYQARLAQSDPLSGQL